MKTIFKNIEGRKWKYNDHVITDIEYTDIARIWVKHKKLYQWNLSLADLLANKSWCIAVWGEEIVSKSRPELKGLFDKEMWKTHREGRGLL